MQGAVVKQGFRSARLLALAATAVCLAGGPPARAEAAVSYADLAPILAERCVLCHAGEFAPAGLALDSHEALLRGSARGPVLIAGRPDESELIRRIRGESQPRMPMTGPPFLTDEEIALFEQWVQAGMPPAPAAAATGQAPAEVAPFPAPGEAVSYLHVAPILARRCAKCHAEQGLMGAAPEGYLLNSYAATIAVGDRVRVVPGHPDASELVRRIRGQAQPMMPFDGPPYLSAEEVRLIEQWVQDGARDATGLAAPVPVGAELRLHGTLGERWTLDGLPLRVDTRTRLDKAPRPGDYVQVRGRVDASGAVRAERIRPR
jgi:mono/diheme cytochrome c family protein